MYCPNCASPIHHSVKFCTHCGINLAAVSDLLNGKIVEPPQSEEVIRLIGICHNGYLSTVIGLGLIITALLIIIAALMFGVLPAALSGLVFLGWAIPALAQGVGKWLKAKSDIRSLLEGRADVGVEGRTSNRLPAEPAKARSLKCPGSITERTTADLNQHA